jgi:hypothetical protein
MLSDRPSRRYPASAFPEIQGIRLAPLGVPAALVNLSSTGVLVDCASRVLPGTVLTVEFGGTFTTPSADGRVSRCEVSGIAIDGSLRYHLGIEFKTQLALPVEIRDEDRDRGAAPGAPPLVTVSEGAGVSRNYW